MMEQHAGTGGTSHVVLEEKSEDFQIRNLSETEIPAIQKWVNSDVGWNFGSASLWRLFLKSDPTGWFVGQINGKKIIANLLGMRIDDKIALVGIYVVDKEYRFKGYGRIIWKSLINHVGTRVLALYSVDYRIEAYKKLGFADPVYSIDVKGTKLKPHVELPKPSPVVTLDDVVLVNVRKYPALLEYLIDYDLDIHTTLRVPFIQECYANTEHPAILVAIDKKWWEAQNMAPSNESPGKTQQNFTNNHHSPKTKHFSGIIGYGCLTKRYIDYAVCPIYANSLRIAKFLFESLITYLPKHAEIEIVLPQKLEIVTISNPDKARFVHGKENKRLNDWACFLNEHENLLVPKLKTTLYRMYKTDLNPNDNLQNGEGEPTEEEAPRNPDYLLYDKSFERFTYLTNNDQQNSQNKDTTTGGSCDFGRNHWGVGQIPFDKIFCLSSLEAYWI